MVDSNTRRNVLSYYLNFIVVALAGLIVNPILLSGFGPVVFGVWKSLQRFLDFATLADGRASQALKWIVASRVNHSNLERRRDIASAVIVWLWWLPMVIMVSIAVTAAVPLLINNIPDDLRQLAYFTAAILAANTVLFGLLSIPDSVLMGINEGYRSMTITTLVYISSNAAMLAAASLGWPLWSIAVITLLGTVVNALITLRVAKRRVLWWGLARPSKSDVRRVMGYSSWTLGSAVVDKLFLSSELILISVMIGAAAVSEYTFTTFVLQFVISIAMVTASGFMPLLGSHIGSHEFEAAAERARSVRHLVVGISSLGASAVLAFNGRFVTIWAGGDQYMGTTLNALLVACGLQFILIRMDGQILDVTMRIAPKVVIGLLTSVGGLAAGIVGYACTNSLELSLLAVMIVRLTGNILFPVLVARSISNSGIALRPVLLAGVVLGISFLLGPASLSAGPLSLIGLTLGWLVIVLGTVWAGLLPGSVVRSLLTGRSPAENSAL